MRFWDYVDGFQMWECWWDCNEIVDSKCGIPMGLSWDEMLMDRVDGIHELFENSQDYENQLIWRFPNNRGYPKSSKSLHHFGIETHGLGDPLLEKPPFGCQWITGGLWWDSCGMFWSILDSYGIYMDIRQGLKKNTWNHLLDGWRLARVNWNVNMKRWDLTWQERRLWEKKHKTWVIV